MSVEIFSSADHKCVVFPDLVRGEDGVQANQFLVVHGKHSALIDPGGALLYTPLNLAISRSVQPRELTYILASHQDPDVIGSVDRWLLYSDCSIVCSKLWGRFIPHSVPHYQKSAGGDRYMRVPDEGMDIPMGDIKLRALPAHFLHSVGNLSFYDPYSKILFSGDIGASLIAAGTAYEPVEDFSSLVGRMEGFHRRYMASNRVTRLWVRMVRQLPIDMIVPQHGLPMKGKAVADFLSWLEELECGVDLLGPANYRIS